MILFAHEFLLKYLSVLLLWMDYSALVEAMVSLSERQYPLKTYHFEGFAP